MARSLSRSPLQDVAHARRGATACRVEACLCMLWISFKDGGTKEEAQRERPDVAIHKMLCMRTHAGGPLQGPIDLAACLCMLWISKMAALKRRHKGREM